MIVEFLEQNLPLAQIPLPLDIAAIPGPQGYGI